MHTMITRDEAVALYKQATKAVTYDGLTKGSTKVCNAPYILTKRLGDLDDLQWSKHNKNTKC